MNFIIVLSLVLLAYAYIQQYTLSEMERLVPVMPKQDQIMVDIGISILSDGLEVRMQREAYSLLSITLIYMILPISEDVLLMMGVIFFLYENYRYMPHHFASQIISYFEMKNLHEGEIK